VLQGQQANSDIALAAGKYHNIMGLGSTLVHLTSGLKSMLHTLCWHTFTALILTNCGSC